MNNEDVIRMAREAGCIPRRHPEYDNDIQVFATPDVLERFAALVAKHERRACVKVCEKLLTIISSGDEHMDGVTDCIVAIRARGEK